MMLFQLACQMVKTSGSTTWFKVHEVWDLVPIFPNRCISPNLLTPSVRTRLVSCSD